ncbi:SAV_2336 N-terminal domain-related protein [Nostoc cycadae]|uniref:Peptidase C14 n=1 Tax=Nostoc cycadae WK-1 TaxID=1861711 RepID=A0A2H6LCQ5_9NOSO|nr:SAV_2336 N-terminal domain-related protein [Nostoc cycadae]GBE90953.1 peptidase C14 [Nostoc cycadae WK-1]
MIDQLITALSKEVEMSAEEIADTIWLALQLHGFQAESVSYDIQKDERTLSKPQSHTTQLEEIPNQRPKEQKAGIYLPTKQKTSKSLGLSFKVPDAPSLRQPLTFARALKPLMRRVPSGKELVLDEAATVQRIADEGLWIPVLKPAVEPWLDLELVVDEAISMQIWRYTIRELERLLKNYGIFRDVRVWGLITDENEQVQIRRGIGTAAKNQTLRSPKELIDPSGRRLVLVVSDCVSSLWRNGRVTPVLELWAKQGSIAIVQMLPKWLWKRTALGRASEVRLQALTQGACNQKLIAREVSFWDELDEETGVKVPVFTLEQDKVATWAQMLSGRGNIWTLGYVFKLNATPVDKESSLFNLTHSDLSAEQRVQAFRVTASPMARKLAGLLASAPVISLPIVRLIRETLLKDSQQVHVAEVFLGGLLKPLSEINADTNPDYVQYEFMDGVRELFVDSVPSQYVLNVVDEVSKYVAKKAGLSLEAFAAVLRNPRQVRDSKIVEEVGYFATVTAQVLRCLGSEYVKVAEELELDYFESDKNLYTNISSGNALFSQGHACIVGVGGDLPNTVDDAVGLANILKDAERCAYPPEQVHLLTKEQANREGILTTLDQLSKSTTPDSTVIVYFSGHGYEVNSPIGKTYYLMPFGYDQTKLHKTAINSAEFITKLQAISAKKLLILFDCCHSGGLGNTSKLGYEAQKAPLPLEAQALFNEGKALVVIASSQSDEKSFAGRPYSAFTLALIEALAGKGASQKDGYVRVADLAMYVREVVPRRTRDRQHPILNFEQADNFILAYYAGGETEPKGLPFEGEPDIKAELEAFNKMTPAERLEETLHRVEQGMQTDEDITFLRQLLLAGDRQIALQLGKYNINIGEGKEIHIGDRIYRGADAETVRKISKEILEVNAIAPTTPFYIYIVYQHDEGLKIDSYSFPYSDIKKNSDYPRFLALLNQLPNLKIQPEMSVVFRISDEVTLDSTNATDNANAGVIVIPQTVLDFFEDSHLAFTYIKSHIDKFMNG